MDLYTLNENFLDKDIVDEYVSAIWTERYSEAGDVQLVVPPTLDNIAKLKGGTFLALRGTNEVMLLETQDIQNGLMTVVGKTLPVFLNNRIAWFKHPTLSTVESRIAEYVDEAAKPGEFIADVVNKTVINIVPFTGSWAPASPLDWEFDEIPFLTLGSIDTSGTDQRLTFPIGPLYEGIKQLAAQHGVGISLYLESADPSTGYSLKFKTYKGVDRTSDQSVNPLVRLLPELDSLADLKEIRSSALYKNICYVYYQGIVTKHLAEPSLPEPEGFDRRVMVRDAEGAPVGTGSYTPDWRFGSWTQTYVTPEDVTKFREQTAKDAFANNNYIHTIDGQTSPINDYEYGVDYGLGDIIELRGITGDLAKAKITEFIRSEDQTGEKGYPTITVIE